jgi:hypothetical protein
MITKLFRLESSLSVQRMLAPVHAMVGHGGGSRCPVGGFKVLARRQHGVPGRGVDGVAAVSCPEPAGGGDLARLYLRLHCRRFLH